jgi:hypothetical protein
MSVEIDEQIMPKITNVMGWIDDDPAEINEVAFCVTDFSKSNGHINQLILTSDEYSEGYRTIDWWGPRESFKHLHS